MVSNRILVVRFGSLGDLILTSATVLNLKLSFPGSEIIFLTKRIYAPVVESFDGVDRVVTVSDSAGLSELIKVLLKLDQERVTHLVDLHGNFRSMLARKLISAERTAVYDNRRAERRQIVSGKLKLFEYTHTIDRYNDSLSQVDGRVFCRRPLIKRTEDNSITSEANQESITIAPGAAHLPKQWGIAKFYDVARTLADKFDVKINWVITGDMEKESSELLKSETGRFKIHIDASYPELIRVISRSVITLANDSGIAHLSSAVGTPVIALFGPTHPALGFAPKGINDRLIEVDEQCRPCSLHGKKKCYRDRQYCFERILPDDVATLAGGVMDRQRNSTPALFVDRDGTIIEDRHYLSDPEQVELIKGSAEALKRAADAGYRLVIVSNQSGVAYGYHDTDAVERVNRRMLELLSAKNVSIDAVYYCPHHREGIAGNGYATDCHCRKPGTGMAEDGVRQLNVDLRRSVVVGDSLVDYNLGRAIGGSSLLVRTGHGLKMEKRFLAESIGKSEDVVDDLASAVDSILGFKR